MTGRRSEVSDSEEETIAAAGRIGLFGFEPVAASVTLFPRSLSWRTRRAVLFGVLGVAIAPVVALLPPHAVWLIGAVATGAYLAWRSFNTRYSVVALDGRCPKCNASLTLKAGIRLREPHPISCQDCSHELALTIDPGQLT